MSHDRGRRGACWITSCTRRFHFDYSYNSMRRDGHGRWLWRLVRRNAKTENLRDEKRALHGEMTRRSFSSVGLPDSTISIPWDRDRPSALTPPDRTAILLWKTSDICFAGCARSRIFDSLLLSK